MKLFIVVSSLDLRQPYSATPAWWQLLKGLAEAGAELIVAPYQGEQQESLWWQAEKNPARWQGELSGGDVRYGEWPRRRDSRKKGNRCRLVMPNRRLRKL